MGTSAYRNPFTCHTSDCGALLAIGSPVPLQVNLTSGWRDLMPGFVRTQWLSWASIHAMTTDRERNLLYVAHVNGLLKVSAQGYGAPEQSRTSCLTARALMGYLVDGLVLALHEGPLYLYAPRAGPSAAGRGFVGTAKGRSCGDNMACG